MNYKSFLFARLFPFARLLRCTAFLLMAMMKDVFPSSCGNEIMPEMFNSFFSIPILSIIWYSPVKILSESSHPFLLSVFKMQIVG